VRKLTIATAFIAAASFSSFAYASGAVTNVDASASVQVSGKSARIQMPHEEFKHFKGYYKLSDGNFVRIYSRNDKFYAQFDDGAKDEIVPVGPTTFVGKSSNVKLVFNEVLDGREFDVVMLAR
jgi:hypothetical protein